MADRKISDLTALTTPASGDYLPIVDISESAAASKNKRITVEELMRGAPDGTAASPGIAFESAPNTGIYSPGADQLAISTNGNGRLVVDASGNINLTWGVLRLATIFDNNYRQGLAFNTANRELKIFSTTNDNGGSIAFYTRNAAGASATDYGAERLRIDSLGRVGIGTSSPTRILAVTNAPDTTNPTNGADFVIASPGLTPTQINSTTAGLGITSIGVNHAGDYHLRSFWGVSIDKGSGNLSGGASNSVNADSRTFAIRQYAGGTTWNTQFCVNGSGNVGIGTTAPTTLLDVNADTVRVRTARTPASATATGATGEICWDANYIYVCIATNTWRRAAISSW